MGSLEKRPAESERAREICEYLMTIDQKHHIYITYPYIHSMYIVYVTEFLNASKPLAKCHRRLLCHVYKYNNRIL